MVLFSDLFSYATLTGLSSQYYSASPTSSVQEYDYIVVGGGTAGCVLARRLSDDPLNKVLVIEAGGSNEGILNMIVPFFGVTLPGTAVDWNFTSVPQQGLNGRILPYTRGYVLGGSSSVNLMTWNRGSQSTWDRWAEITGDNGWSWDAVQTFYKKTFHMVPPANEPDQTSSVAFGNGPVQVSFPGFPTELDDRVINSSVELGKQHGSRFFFTENVNEGLTLGFTKMQSSIGGGERSSAATAYLAPILYRSNLDVVLSTRALKVLPDDASAAIPTIQTVQVGNLTSDKVVRFRAKNELVLSTGVFGTPHLLQVSGIGDAAALVQKGIQPLIDLPSVGKNLTDHALVANYFLVNSNMTFGTILGNSTLFGEVLAQWMANRTGLFVDSPGNTQGFMRLPPNSSALHGIKNPASGPTAANTEFIFVDGFAPFGPAPIPATGNFMTVLTAVVSPLSRGSVSVASSDALSDPVIDPELLTADFDVAAMIQAMIDAKTFLTASPWTGYIQEPFGNASTATTDAAREAAIRGFADTVNHPARTASMSPVDASWGVVDPNLKLKKAQGLRIVDASVFPAIPECHIQALVYTVAERASALILTDNL